MEEAEQVVTAARKKRVLNGEGKAALQGELGRILGAPVGPASADVSWGAERALDLVEIARAPEIAERLALIPDALFSSARVAELERLALAALHLDEVHQRAGGADKAGPGEEPKLGEALLQEAEAVRATLHKLLDYHFGDDPQIAGELGDGRGRRGAFRVAATLARLAALARERVAVLAKDTKYWRENLCEEADRLAAEVHDSVSELSEKDALELKRRAFQLLEGPFADLRLTLSWLLRDEPSKVLALPVLKRPAQRKKAEA